MKRIAATLLALTLFAVCLPTGAAARTPPKKQDDFAEVPATLSELPLSFKFASIPAGRVFCIGRIDISPHTVYQMNAVAQYGNKDLFVALNPYDDDVVYDRTKWGWHQFLSSDGEPITAIFQDISSEWEKVDFQKPTDQWYAYVGSCGGELRNVSGTLSVQE